MDGGQISKVCEAGIESNEHACECMRRELVDHPPSNKECPIRQYVCCQGGEEHGHRIQREDNYYEKIHGYKDAIHHEQCPWLTSYIVSPSSKVKSGNDNWHKDDI